MTTTEIARFRKAFRNLAEQSDEDVARLLTDYRNAHRDCLPQRYTCTLADGTALSVEAVDATAAHNIVAQYMGVQPTTGGHYIMYMRIRLADEWTKREIGLAIKVWRRSS